MPDNHSAIFSILSSRLRDFSDLIASIEYSRSPGSKFILFSPFALSTSRVQHPRYCRDRKQDKSSPPPSFPDIFISRKQISASITAPPSINCTFQIDRAMQRAGISAPSRGANRQRWLLRCVASPSPRVKKGRNAPFSAWGVCRRAGCADAFGRWTSRGTFRVMRIRISVVYAPRYFRSDMSIGYLENFCIPSCAAPLSLSLFLSLSLLSSSEFGERAKSWPPRSSILQAGFLLPKERNRS